MDVSFCNMGGRLWIFHKGVKDRLQIFHLLMYTEACIFRLIMHACYG